MNDVAVSPYNTMPEVLKDFSLPENIVIYDSTLRDGEQMPGISFSSEQKLTIARKLDEMGVPEIEAGFPAVSKTEQETVKTIANEGLSAKILALSRLKKRDIDAAIQSDADMVLLFIASSPLHLQYKLHFSEEEIKEKVVESIEYAKDHGITPSFSTEDSTRTPLSFLKELVILAHESGAKRIGFTDTVGCATPQTIQYLFSYMKRVVPLPFSAHLHNDFGLGLIN
ncbi:MAG: 2-isopropylmalate synthase, partial [Thermoplasmatales archaeon]|nr:2-isopropylmalate synthase [Thermoplasmatales archaeon]